MQVNADTKVHDLLEGYPFLKPWLTAYAPDFKKLENPVVYNTMARFATLEAASAMAERELDVFLDDIRAEIARHEILAEESAGGVERAAVDTEDRARRQEQLKTIIKRLHDGDSIDEVKADFDALATGVDSFEIAAMEQSLIAEGMPVEEVQRLCDVHVSVFKESLEATSDAAAQPALRDDHPIAAYQRENAVLGTIVAEVRRAADRLEASEPEHRATTLAAVSAGLERLAGIDTHYTRKENQLFPVLEHHGVEGPTKVMWGLDDDIRDRLKTARALAAAGDASALVASLQDTLRMIDDMVYKEEKILFPTALQVVTDDEWAQMALGDAEIGYAWIESPESTVTSPAATVVPDTGGPMLLPLPTGALSIEQLGWMLQALPFDVSYVDENDRVRFYSEGERVFPRSPAAIGREVRNCHPPKSLAKVEEILASFKAGEKDLAEFWIELSERFIHIRYFAMRDEDGTYRGCLEVVQDATHVRALEGQRRLVQW